jgi:hypothetical protein
MRCKSIALVSALSLLAVSGCAYPYYGGEGPPSDYGDDGHVEEQQHHHGPPPHAPVWGRYRHSPRPRAEMVFDDGLGVYAIVGYADHYYFGGRYYRWFGGAWQVSYEISDGWGRCERRALPGHLSRKHSKHAKRSKRDRDYGEHRGHGRDRGDHDRDRRYGDNDGDHRGRGRGGDDDDRRRHADRDGDDYRRRRHGGDDGDPSEAPPGSWPARFGRGRID